MTTAPVGAVVTESELYSFTSSGDDGANPYASLVQAGDGSFYGTTNKGGIYGYGTIFKLSPDGVRTTLHSFSAGKSDGSYPWARLLLASDGNLYGTTLYGGQGNYGTIFKLTLDGDYTLVHSFVGDDGSRPYSGLIQAKDGTLYGTTSAGGTYYGVLYKMSLTGQVTVITKFGSTGSTGAYPIYEPTEGPDGNIYLSGTCLLKITPSGGAITSLYCFPGKGYNVVGYPSGPLLLGVDGSFYLTTVNNNNSYSNSQIRTTESGSVKGQIIKMTPAGVPTVLYNFTGADGDSPNGALVQAKDGTLYGTTYQGGENSLGTAFQVLLSGVETATSIHSFGSGTGTATQPFSAVIQGADGNLYGTTASGGDANLGAIYKLSGAGTIPPVAPTLSLASAGDAQIALTWTASPGADSYSIYQGTAVGAESKTPVQTGLSNTTTTVTGLANGTMYYFKVAAVGNDGTSDLSNEVSATPLAVPEAPSGLAATPSDSQVALNWEAATGATSYIVYQGTASGAETPLATGVTATSYTATGLSNGQAYYYTVAGVNSSGTGPQSSEASATPVAAGGTTGGDTTGGTGGGTTGGGDTTGGTTGGDTTGGTSGGDTTGGSTTGGDTTGGTSGGSSTGGDGGGGGGAFGPMALAAFGGLALIRRRRKWRRQA